MAKDVSLRKAKVFTGMLPDDMSLLERIGRRELFNPGETVFTGKIRGHSLFVIESGCVEVMRPEADGTQKLLARLRPGTSFGEAAMLDGHPRIAIGIASGSTGCWMLDSEGLRLLWTESPATATRLLSNLSRVMAGRLARTVSQVCGAVDGPELALSPKAAGKVSRSLWDRLMGR
jgi:CRP-like cAMP-binding protein